MPKVLKALLTCYYLITIRELLAGEKEKASRIAFTYLQQRSFILLWVVFELGQFSPFNPHFI